MSEPLVNFQRVNGSVPNILQTASATCCCVCAKFIAIGTSTGAVHVLEMMGREWRRLNLFRCRVTDLCTDEAGDWIGASAEDGKVAVAAVHTDEVHTHSHDRAVHAVRISPDYARSRDRPLLTGGQGGKLRVLKRMWGLGLLGIGQTQERVLHGGEGPIRAIVWRGTLIAWANDSGVKLFDMGSEERVGFIQSEPGQAGGQAEACPPRLAWVNDTRLLIGWGDLIKVVEIKEKRVGLTRQQAEAAGMSVPTGEGMMQGEGIGGDVAGEEREDQALFYVKRRYGEVTSRLPIADGYVAGIAPYGEQVACLCLEPPGEGEEDKALPTVDLRILSMTGQELSRDILRLRGLSPSTSPADISLACDPESMQGADGLPLLFICGQGDLVVASPRSVGDHIEWSFAQGQLSEAIDVALQCPGALPEPRMSALRSAYLTHLLDGGQAEKAGLACAALLGTDARLWEQWVGRFLAPSATDVPVPPAGAHAFLSVLPLPHSVRWTAQAQAQAGEESGRVGQPSQIVPVPARPPVQLPSACYDIALAYLLRACPVDALSAVQAWRVKLRGQKVVRADTDAPSVLVNPSALYEQAVSLLIPPERSMGDGDIMGVGVGVEARLHSPLMQPLYSVQGVLDDVTAVLGGLDGPGSRRPPYPSPPSPITLQALRDVEAELCVTAGQPGRAVTACMGYLGTLTGGAATTAARHALALISSHGLYDLVSGDVAPLLLADPDTMLTLLADRVQAQTGGFPIPGVLAQLRGRPQEQHAYLARLSRDQWDVFNGPAAAPFHSLYARLTAQYDRPRLLPFLQRTSHIPLEDMRALCEEGVEGEGDGRSGALQRELAWVLGRLGAAREALSLLLEGLGDVRGAVEFVAGTEDDGLWGELVARIVRSGSGSAAGALLDALPGTGLKAVKVLAALPPSVSIPDLQVRLLRVLTDAALSRRLTTVCADLVRRDTFGLHSRLVARQKDAFRVHSDVRCGLCQSPAGEPKAEYVQGKRGRGRTGSAIEGGEAAHDTSSQSSGGGGGGQSSRGGGGGQSSRGGGGGEVEGPTVVLYWCAHAFHDTCLRTSSKAAAGGGKGGKSRGRTVSINRGGSFSGGKEGPGSESFNEGAGLGVEARARAKSAASGTARGVKVVRQGQAGMQRSGRDTGRVSFAESVDRDTPVHVRRSRSHSSVPLDSGDGGDTGGGGMEYGRCPLCFSNGPAGSQTGNAAPV